MWAKQNIWLSLWATSLRPLPYTVNPPKYVQGCIYCFGYNVVTHSWGRDSSSLLYLSELSFIVETNPNKWTRPLITLDSQFPERPSALELFFAADPPANHMEAHSFLTFPSWRVLANLLGPPGACRWVIRKDWRRTCFFFPCILSGFFKPVFFWRYPCLCLGNGGQWPWAPEEQCWVFGPSFSGSFPLPTAENTALIRCACPPRRGCSHRSQHPSVLKEVTA